ncbi:MAG: hypothetical protein IJO40_09995 [Thermoguttaceae bacterium]|nr:hypothetical protein [Thermoguttaceae bacterium]
MQAKEPLQRVVAGQPISAADWNRIVDRINAGATATVRPNFATRGARRELRVRNDSATRLEFLSVVAVRGFASRFVDLNAALNDATVLAVGLPTGADGEFLATLREPLAPNDVGAATPASGALFLAEVVDAASSGFATPATDAANAGKLVASGSGPFRIVARSDSGVCLLTPVVEAPVDPFVIDYVERQPSYPTGSYISNRTWRDEHTPNGLKCYLCYCDLYDDREATLDALFAKKLRWDVTARDWAGTHVSGGPGEFYYPGSSTVLTPVCCGIRATILTGSEYVAADVRTWSYRNGWTDKPPLTGRAFFPFPITLEFALSWNDAEDERAFFNPYRAAFDSDSDAETVRFVLDHPRRHFEALDDVPDVFFLPGLRGATIQLLCPVCYVPRQAEYIFDFETVYETDDAFRFALETRPFKNAKGDRYAKKYWEADGTPPNALTSAVALGYKSARFTTKFSTAKGTPETPSGFAATVDGATATFTWGTRQYATNYPLRIENLAGKIVASWAPVASPATWTAKESGDYVAYLAAANAVDARSDETSVAFSVEVPAT